LDQFDFAFQPGLDARKIKDLATLEFVKAKSNVAMLGPPGVGKTMLAVALAVGACQAGLSIYFTTLDDLVRRLRAAEATSRFNRQLHTHLRPAVLVVVDLCGHGDYAEAAGPLGWELRWSRVMWRPMVSA
jgi:DNA replication protein DnaC